jgi:acetyl-CoA acetyltransferase
VSSGTDRRTSGLDSASTRAARRAYEQAGIDPSEVNVAELHDAVASAELYSYEELQLAAPNAGVELLRSGATALGGRLPVNTSGGLIARGHPLGATGCAQLVELVGQLRGANGSRQVENARVALGHNVGGWLGDDGAVACVTLLTREDRP